MSPLVSIIIPVFNRAEEVQSAIRSVLAQTFQDWELILIDDKSTDNLHEVLETFTDKRLRILKHDHRQNAAATRNTGIQAARGRYLAFLDSDDEWLPEKLSRQVSALEAAAPDEKMCITACLLDRGGGEWEVRTPELAPDALTALTRGCTLNPGAALMVEREAFLQCGDFDTSMIRLEDWEWLLRYARRWKILVIKEPLAIVHVTDRADLEAVVRTLPLIWDRCSENLNKAQKRRLRATLMIEKGFINYLTGRYIEAGVYILSAAALDPGRLPEITWRILRRFWRKIKGTWLVYVSDGLDRRRPL